MNLLDTDVIIELLRKKQYEVGAISTVTLIEVLRGLDAEKRARAKKLLEESFSIQAIDNKVIEAYCSLYQKLRSEGTQIPDADLIIAATAISRNMTLKTGDEHFRRLKNHGLKIATQP
jgi:predicted nucleic acid-binding protein